MKENAPTAVPAPEVAEDPAKSATADTGEATPGKERKARQAKPTETHYLEALVDRSGEGRAAIDVKTAMGMAKKLVKLAPNIISLLTLAGVPIPSQVGELATLVIDKADALGLLDAQSNQSAAVPA